MPFITEQRNWYILYVALFVWLFWKGGRTGRYCGLLLIFTLVLSDQIGSSIIKPLVNRPRPCHIPQTIRLLCDCGPGKSFPSSHAVNNFAAAYILSKFYKEYKWLFFTIASLVAFSRIYVGVHYPFDALGGALIGIIIALIVVLIYELMEKKLRN